jgi:hypothetical protein
MPVMHGKGGRGREGKGTAAQRPSLAFAFAVPGASLIANNASRLIELTEWKRK